VSVNSAHLANLIGHSSPEHIAARAFQVLRIEERDRREQGRGEGRRGEKGGREGDQGGRGKETERGKRREKGEAGKPVILVIDRTEGCLNPSHIGVFVYSCLSRAALLTPLSTSFFSQCQVCGRVSEASVLYSAAYALQPSSTKIATNYALFLYR
jgi:hypothetical protein